MRGDIIKSIYKTVSYVTLFSCIERFLGFVYRIFLSRNLGAEGLGIYQLALTVFGVLVTLSTSGIPITVSRLMTKYKAAKNKNAENGVIFAGIIFSLCLSVPVALLFGFGNGFFSFLFADSRCLSIFLVMLPGLVFTSVYAVLRGSFWGNKSFLAYSLIELLEELCMLVCGVILVNISTSMLDGARRAGMAVLISYLFSFTVATAFFFIRGGKFGNPTNLFKPLAVSALPITCMRTCSSLVNSAVAVILPARLVAFGLSKSLALSEFGIAFGMAIPLLFMPSTLIGSLAIVLVPELSYNYYKNQNIRLKRNIEKAIKFSVFVSCVIIPLFISLGEELCLFFYNNIEAGRYLSFAAVIMFPMSLTMISSSMLNSLNMERKTLLFFLFGSTFMLASVYFLPKYFGTYSLIIGFLLSFSVTAFLNLFLLGKKSREKLVYGKFSLLSVAFIVPSTFLGFLLKNLLHRYLPNFPTLLIAGVAVVAFSLTLYKIFCDTNFLAPFGASRENTH